MPARISHAASVLPTVLLLFGLTLTSALAALHNSLPNRVPRATSRYHPKPNSTRKKKRPNIHRLLSLWFN
jgi:hypothetical protein